MEKLLLFRFMDAYFSTLIAQMDDLAAAMKNQNDLNNLIAPRSKTDPKNSPELVNIKKVFQSPKFDDKDLHEIVKVPSLTFFSLCSPRISLPNYQFYSFYNIY